MTVRLTALIMGITLGGLFVRHARAMVFDGVGVDDGGGFVALLLTEFFACTVALAIVFYVHA